METKALKIWILGGCWLHFWRLFGAFWEPKSVKKSSDFLDAFLEAKREMELVIWGRPSEVRGPLEEDIGGVSSDNKRGGTYACQNNSFCFNCFGGWILGFAAPVG